MCVIIYRKPNITIPFEKLVSACKVNSDGMGIVVFDRGKLEMRKFFDPAGNDPEVLQQHLEAAKGLHTYVHLRYRTKGDTDKHNVHPFGVLTKKKHGADLQFMHNGTLTDFGTKTDCDSKHFAKVFLQPLAERFSKAVGKENVTNDPMFTAILEKFAGRSSVFLLADSYGNHNIVNYDSGKEFDGWWASNEYSFNSYHREPKTHYPNNNWKDDNWKPKKVLVQNENEKQVITLAPVPPGDTKSPFNDEVPWKDETAKEVAKKPIVSPTLPGRERFIDAAEITSLKEACQLSRTDIEDLVDEYPEHAVLLILDLLKELYDREMEANDSYYEAA